MTFDFVNAAVLSQPRLLQGLPEGVGAACETAVMGVEMANSTCVMPVDFLTSAVDICTEGGDAADCDVITTFVDYIYCEAAHTASTIEDDDVEADCSAEEIGILVDYVYDMYDAILLDTCDGDEPQHVCFTDGTIDLEAAREESANSVGGGEETEAPEESGDSDSAANLVALAGVSLAAAAMLA